MQNSLLIKLVYFFYQSLKFLKFPFLGYLKESWHRNFCKTSILTVRNLAAGFGAKSIDFDVTMIKKIEFSSFDKEFLKKSQNKHKI